MQGLRATLTDILYAAHWDYEFFESKWNCTAFQGMAELSKAKTVEGI